MMEFNYVGCNSAQARRSASGSLAKITVDRFLDAVARASFSVSRSSGLGKVTVEKYGSGLICSSTATKGF